MVSVAVLVSLIGAMAKLTADIYRAARRDEARSADVIVVLGAAKYHARPSPIFRARLEHALSLYRRGLAPRILTTGGSGGDPQFTEADIGRAWLVTNNVPSEAIIVEPEAESTAQSTAAIAEIMRRMNLGSAIIVSDGYHLYRVKRMLDGFGITAYGSPRPTEPRSDAHYLWLCARQAVAYLLWSIGIAV